MVFLFLRKEKPSPQVTAHLTGQSAAADLAAKTATTNSSQDCFLPRSRSAAYLALPRPSFAPETFRISETSLFNTALRDAVSSSPAITRSWAPQKRSGP